MSGKNTSFEERLARIQENNGAPQMPAAGQTPPPVKPKSPRRNRGGGNGGGRGMIIGLVFAFGFLAMAGVAFVAVLTSEDLFVKLAGASAEAEIEGRTTAATFLMGGDGGADMAIKLAVKSAQARLDSGELTEEEAARTRAFIKNKEGKGAVDIMRGNMRGMMMFKAQTEDQLELGETYAAKLDACQSTTCLAYVDVQFSNALQVAVNR